MFDPSMGREETPATEPRRQAGSVAGRRRGDRRFRRIPSAITPLRATDVAAGLAAHLRGRGRDKFRADVAGRLDAGATATYTSYRRALGACLRTLRAEADGRDAVLIPAFCSSDFVDAVRGVGLALERYDVDARTLAMDLDDVERRLDGDVLALLAANVLGYSSPMEAAARACEDHGVALVETLGYAVGSRYRGSPLGTFGDRAVLNFQQGKPIPVGGGMVVSGDPSVDLAGADRAAASPNAGTLAGYAAFAHPRPYYLYSVGADLADRYDLLDDRVTTHPGSKLDVDYEPPFETMSNFQGAVGRRVLARLDDHRRERARTARFYDDRLADCDRVDRLRPVDGLEKHQHVRYPVVVDAPGLRTRLCDALEGVGVQASPLYDWPPVDGDRYPGGARLQRGLLTLPTHPYVTDEDRRTVVRTVRSVAG